MVMGLKVEGRKGSDVTVRPMPVSSSVGYEIHEFLAWEAFLLDHQRYGEWIALLSRDLCYRGPAELFAQPGEPQSTPVDSRPVRDYNFILTRVRELEGRLAADEPEEKILTAERRDCLRRMSDSFQITRRELRIARVPMQMRQWVRFL